MNREQLFREALKENSHRVFRICSYFFTDIDDRHDACQETLIRIWENLPSFRGQARVSTWIYRVTVNTCLSHIRNEKRRNGLMETFCNTETFQVAEQPADADDGIEVEKTCFLKRFMADLNAADRTLVSLYLEDLTTREMAEITGISEANVRVRIHRVKERIKNSWEEEQQHGT